MSTTINRRAFLTNAGLGLGGLALAGGVFSQRDAIIHGAIKRHPEWLQEMATDLQKRRNHDIVQAHKAALFEDKRDPVLFSRPAGPEKMRVLPDLKIVEVIDPQCPFCKQMTPVVRQLYESDPGLSVIVKIFPFLDQMSVTAAKVGYAMKLQDKFDPWYYAMMADTTQEHALTDARLFEIVASAGGDVERVKKDMALPEIGVKVRDNQQLASMIGVAATPWIIIGDNVVSGAATIDDLRRAVADARSSLINAKG